MMQTGAVKWFNDAKGFVFITPDGAEKTCSRIFPRSKAAASNRCRKTKK